jgi:hypothetical protein
VELWRSVCGYEGYYSISNLGQVRRDGRARSARVGKILRPQTHANGYLVVGLWRANKRKLMRVHRLVTEAFLGPHPDGYEVNHKDADRGNNRLSNLEYVTRSQNLRHASKLGRLNIKRGEASPRAKYSDQEVQAIREASGSIRQIANRFAMPQSTVWGIRSGHRRCQTPRSHETTAVRDVYDRPRLPRS